MSKAKENRDIVGKNLRDVNGEMLQTLLAHSLWANEDSEHLEHAYRVRSHLRHLKRQVDDTLTALAYHIKEGGFE